jgi:hypothetical protein
MPAVRVMQMPRYQVVAVISVRDDLMPTARAVNMGLLVLAASVCGRAGDRIRSSRIQRALIDVVVVHPMEMAVVEVVRVVAVPDSRVPTAGRVRMIVSAMGLVLGHVFAPPCAVCAREDHSTRRHRHKIRGHQLIV